MADSTSRHPHWRGLDGLRAIAVIAVVVFHFSPDALPGGFLGVDIFFVISGYLITRLIATEFVRRRHLDAPAFYRRRARRLLPALAVVLIAIVASALIWRDQLATVRPGVVFSAIFSANWWLAFAHQPYFVATGRPSMLQHLWSLGIEEQFYLLWPLVVATTMGASWRRMTRRGINPAEAPRRLMAPVSAIAVALALLSTALTWVLANRWGVPYGNDGSVLYYGTDTHSMGLLLGAALGAWAAGTTRSSGAPDARTKRTALFDLTAVGALVGVALLTRLYAGYSHSLYRGGFLLVSALVALVIAGATRPASRLGPALDTPILRWIGVRSYSIYLWHWPITVVTRPGLDTTMPTWLDQALRVIMTVVLSDLTYRLVEGPVRRLGVRGAFAALATHLHRVTNPTLARAAFTAVTALPVFAAGVLVVGPRAPAPAAALGTTGGTHLVLHSAARHTTHPNHQVGHRRPPNALPKISGFGDSVLLDARHALAKRFRGGSIDAVVGRQPGPILDDVRRADRTDELKPVVIIHAGNNGLIRPDQLESTLRGLARDTGVRVVLVVNDHLDSYDHSWQKPNNAMLARVVPHFAKARLVDWDKVASRHRGWLYSDDLHLRPKGAVGYADLLATTCRHALDVGAASRSPQARTPRELPRNH